jgi:AcrR family transcriptional regulator
MPSGTNTRERIVDGAERCMQVLGIDRVTVQEAARQSGVSRGLVYRYFRDRQELVDAVIERAADRFLAVVAEHADRRRTLAGQIAEAIVLVRSTVERPHLVPAGGRDSLLAAALSSRLERLHESWLAFWVQCLAAAERRGEIRAGLDHRALAEWILRILLSYTLLPPLVVPAEDVDRLTPYVRYQLLLGPAAPVRQSSA